MSRPHTKTRPSRPMGAKLVSLLAVLTLAVGLFSLAGVINQAPALSPDLRVAPEGRDWRPDSGFAFYDQSLYLQERTEWLMQNADDPLALFLPLELALQSVEEAPADAYAWMWLATSATALGLPDLAQTALARSRTLAPFSAGLSLERLALAPLLPAPTADAAEGLRRDITVARTHAAGPLNSLSRRSEAIATVLADYPLEEND